MAGNSLRPAFVTLFMFAIILFPMVICDAAQFAQEVVCPTCVCCTPKRPGSCCQCCAASIETPPENGSP
ncbi:hypothetical protein I3843_01G221000 [Carya illinoinensis]|nr:hypothetical protein I3760_01G225900 [Carya illinoinensis]KAG7997656.1 hypothetical protein I3843_01G221000 [Carya illinoinensis]